MALVTNLFDVLEERTVIVHLCFFEKENKIDGCELTEFLKDRLGGIQYIEDGDSKLILFRTLSPGQSIPFR